MNVGLSHHFVHIIVGQVTEDSLDVLRRPRLLLHLAPQPQRQQDSSRLIAIARDASQDRDQTFNIKVLVHIHPKMNRVARFRRTDFLQQMF